MKQRETYVDPAAFDMRLKQLIRTDAMVTFDINPMMAEAMLKYNTANRPLSRRRIELFAAEMLNDRWELTGEALIFSKQNGVDNAVLNNGQHRLLACQLANKSFPTDVRFGIERRAYKVTDLGKKRSQGDALSIEGEKNCTTLASALAWIYRYQEGLPQAARDPCSIERTFTLLEAHPDIRKSVEAAMRLSYRYPGFQAGPMAFAHYCMAQRDADRADEFIERVGTGLGITEKEDPIYRLRQRIQQTLMSRLELRGVDQIAITFKAWNAFRAKRPVGQLSWRSEGPAAEPFPEPV